MTDDNRICTAAIEQCSGRSSVPCEACSLGPDPKTCHPRLRPCASRGARGECTKSVREVCHHRVLRSEALRFELRSHALVCRILRQRGLWNKPKSVEERELDVLLDMAEEVIEGKAVEV